MLHRVYWSFHINHNAQKIIGLDGWLVDQLCDLGEFFKCPPTNGNCFHILNYSDLVDSSCLLITLESEEIIDNQ